MADSNRRRLTVGKAPDPASIKGGAGAKSKLCKLLVENADLNIATEDREKVQCIHSVTDSELKKKRSFAEKDKGVKNGSVFCENVEKDLAANKEKVPDIPVFYTCRKGLKPESPNQDSYAVVRLPGKWTLYGVFDGHGPNGHDVSDFAVSVLCEKFLSKEFITATGDSFKEAFCETQELIEAKSANAKAKGPSEGIDASSSGSTCTMAFHNIETDVLVIAHVGDSRGVVYKGDQAFRTDENFNSDENKFEDKAKKSLPAGTQKMEIIYATEDHKPNLPEEKKRIEAKGGRVVFDGYYNYRVFAAKGMYPGLNMSRALGDVVAHKEAGLVAEPEIKSIELKEHRGGKPLTFVIASDGVWEFIINPQAPGFLTKGAAGTGVKSDCWDSLDVNQVTVDLLAKKSWDSWMKDSDNEISDDISVLAAIL